MSDIVSKVSIDLNIELSIYRIDFVLPSLHPLVPPRFLCNLTERKLPCARYQTSKSYRVLVYRYRIELYYLSIPISNTKGFVHSK